MARRKHTWRGHFYPIVFSLRPDAVMKFYTADLRFASNPAIFIRKDLAVTVIILLRVNISDLQ